MYIKPHLEEIEQRIADGETEGSIAKSCNISLTTWTQYKEQHLELLETIKRGNRCLDKAVENALAKSAQGYFVEESEKVYNSNGTLLQEKKKKRYIPPSQTAQVFWLKNRCKDLWKDRSVLDIEEGGAIPKVEVVVKDLKKTHLFFYEHHSLYVFDITI